MPWIGYHDGRKRSPEQVPLSTDVECPTCGQSMHVRRRSSDGRARHFAHNPTQSEGGGGSTACESVGESDLHLKLKSLTASRLDRLFDESHSSVELEKPLEAPTTDKEQRVGDVVLELQPRDEALGEGIVAEVQYRNESKDIERTTADYVAQNYAVLWLTPDDFSEDRLDMLEVDIRRRARKAVWPDHVPSVADWKTTQYNHRYQREQMWRPAKELGLTDTSVPATLPPEWSRQDPPERPPNPYDDVQCWKCGNYWHVSKERDNCGNCGTPVDLQWNILTGRIDPDTVD